MQESTEKILNQLVARVVLRRFELPVVMVLETIRPLAGSISLLGEAILPILAPLLGINQKQLQVILEDREFIPRLIEKLEDPHKRGEQLGC
jgi:hypothetical protein